MENLLGEKCAFRFIKQTMAKSYPFKVALHQHNDTFHIKTIVTQQSLYRTKFRFRGILFQSFFPFVEHSVNMLQKLCTEMCTHEKFLIYSCTLM